MADDQQAKALIERLGLAAHPEGGWYRETFRSETMFEKDALPAGFPSRRCAMTSILFLLRTGECSAWHRVRGEELWIHQGGDELRLAYRETMDDEPVHTRCIGLQPESAPQAVIPAGWWQAARALPGPHGYALMACVVAPGFDFEDFELA